QKRQRLLVTLLGLRHRDAEAVELAPAIALADAKIEPPVRQQIERRRLLGEQGRVVPGQYQDRGAEPHRRRLCRQVGQEIDRRRDLTEPGEMVLDEEDAVKAKRLGLADIVDVIGVDAAVAGLLARVGAGAAKKPELHRVLLTGTAAY